MNTIAGCLPSAADQFLMYRWHHHQNIITFALMNTLLLGSGERLQICLQSLRRWASHFIY